MAVELFQIIDEKSEKYIDFLEELCNIESPTNYKAGVDKVGELCASLAEKNDWQVEVFKQKISGNTLLITMNPGAEGGTIVLSAHMDTVHSVGSFGAEVTRRDFDNIYGPGVMDCKGGIAAAFLAMEALSHSKFKSKCVKFYLQSDEENSSITSNKETIKQMCLVAEGAKCFLNLEGYVADTAVLVRKGIIRYSFVVHGRAIHSARCAYGANAIAEAASKIIELEKMKDVEGITCNCGIINGGTTANTVAELCSFTADIRFANNEQLEEAKEKIMKVARSNYIEGCTTEIFEISYRPAMPMEQRNLDLLNQINKIYRQYRLPTLTPRVCVSGSDAAYITEVGVPCIDCIGTEGGNIHSVREYAKLSSVAESAKRIAAVIMEI